MIWNRRWLLAVLWIAVLAPAGALPHSLLLFPDYSSRGLPIYYAAIAVLLYWTMRYSRQAREDRERAALHEEFGYIETMTKLTGKVGEKVSPERLPKPRLIDPSVIEKDLDPAHMIPPSLLMLQTGLTQSELAWWSSGGEMFAYFVDRPVPLLMILAGMGSLVLSYVLGYFYSPQALELASKLTATAVLLLFIVASILRTSEQK